MAGGLLTTLAIAPAGGAPHSLSSPPTRGLAPAAGDDQWWRCRKRGVSQLSRLPRRNVGAGAAAAGRARSDVVVATLAAAGAGGNARAGAMRGAASTATSTSTSAS